MVSDVTVTSLILTCDVGDDLKKFMIIRKELDVDPHGMFFNGQLSFMHHCDVTNVSFL